MLKFDDGQQRTLRKLPIYGAAAIPVATIEILLSTTHTSQDKNLSVHFIDVRTLAFEWMNTQATNTDRYFL